LFAKEKRLLRKEKRAKNLIQKEAPVANEEGAWVFFVERKGKKKKLSLSAIGGGEGGGARARFSREERGENYDVSRPDCVMPPGPPRPEMQGTAFYSKGRGIPSWDPSVEAFLVPTVGRAGRPSSFRLSRQPLRGKRGRTAAGSRRSGREEGRSTVRARSPVPPSRLKGKKKRTDSRKRDISFANGGKRKPRVSGSSGKGGKRPFTSTKGKKRGGMVRGVGCRKNREGRWDHGSLSLLRKRGRRERSKARKGGEKPRRRVGGGRGSAPTPILPKKRHREERSTGSPMEKKRSRASKETKKTTKEEKRSGPRKKRRNSPRRHSVRARGI